MHIFIPCSYIGTLDSKSSTRGPYALRPAFLLAPSIDRRSKRSTMPVKRLSGRRGVGSGRPAGWREGWRGNLPSKWQLHGGGKTSAMSAPRRPAGPDSHQRRARRKREASNDPSPSAMTVTGASDRAAYGARRWRCRGDVWRALRHVLAERRRAASI